MTVLQSLPKLLVAESNLEIDSNSTPEKPPSSPPIAANASLFMPPRKFIQIESDYDPNDPLYQKNPTPESKPHVTVPTLNPWESPKPYNLYGLAARESDTHSVHESDSRPHSLPPKQYMELYKSHSEPPSNNDEFNPPDWFEDEIIQCIRGLISAHTQSVMEEVKQLREVLERAVKRESELRMKIDVLGQANMQLQRHLVQISNDKQTAQYK